MVPSNSSRINGIRQTRELIDEYEWQIRNSEKQDALWNPLSLLSHCKIIVLILLAINTFQAAGQIQHSTPNPQDVQMREAIEAGDLSAVQQMLDNGFDPNRLIAGSDEDNEKKPPLAFAIENEARPVFNLLLDRGASPNSGIKEASGADDSFYILTLYRRGADIFAIQPILAEYDSEETITALKEAITKGKATDPKREAKTLIDSMIGPINKRLPTSQAENRVPEVIQILIDAGCDPNGILVDTDVQGNLEETTFLIRALHTGRYLTAEELIRHGANVNQPFTYYQSASTGLTETETALMEFSRLGRSAAVRFLLFNHADPKLKNSDGFSALALAIEAVPYQGVIEALLIGGADPNEKIGPEALTPLMIAVSKKDTATANTLLNFGANPTFVDRFGRHLKDLAKPQSTLFSARTPDSQNTRQMAQLLTTHATRKPVAPLKALDPVTAVDIALGADRLSRTAGIGERNTESEDTERHLRRVCSTILENLIKPVKPDLQNALTVYSTYFALMNYADAWATLSEDIRGGSSYIRYSISTGAFLDVIRDRKRVLSKLIFKDNHIPKFDSSTPNPLTEQTKLFRKVEKRTRHSDNSARDYSTLLQLWKTYRKTESNLARLTFGSRKQANLILARYDRYSIDQHNLRIKEAIDRLHAYQ
jgi:ankyrin repeat protein